MGGGAARCDRPHGGVRDRALIAATAGIILLGLLRTPLRWSGAAIIGIGIVWSLAVKQPDILVSADGHNVGVRGRDGRLHLIRTAKDSFMVKEWLAADADGRPPADPTLRKASHATTRAAWLR